MRKLKGLRKGSVEITIGDIEQIQQSDTRSEYSEIIDHLSGKLQLEQQQLFIQPMLNSVAYIKKKKDPNRFID